MPREIIKLITANKLEHFFYMGESEQNLVRKWFVKANPETKAQEKFLDFVNEALMEIDYTYRISAIEPSIAPNGRLYFEKGKPIVSGLKLKTWSQKAKEYAPEFDSRLATLYELYLWYAYRIAKGYWTLQYVCDNSSAFGNYWNSLGALYKVANAGVTLVGGFYDGTGNSYKVVTHEEYYRMCGGDCFNTGDKHPVGRIVRGRNQEYVHCDTGVVVLLK